MVHAVSHRPLAAETHVRFQTGACEFCVGQSDTATGFSPSTDVLPCHYDSISAAYSSSSTCCSYQKDERAKPRELPKSSVLSKIGAHY
jgi:hypothetical protein